MKNLKQIMLASGMFFSSLGLVACASNPSSGSQESTGQYIQNAAVTAKVKSILFDTPYLDSANITVVTYTDKVVLSGTVVSAAQSNLAEKTTENLVGTRTVENDLVVTSPDNSVPSSS